MNEVDVSSISLVSGSVAVKCRQWANDASKTPPDHHLAIQPTAGFETPWQRLREAVPPRNTAAIQHSRLRSQSARNGCFARVGTDGSGLHKLELKNRQAEPCYGATLAYFMRVLQLSQTSTDIDLCSLTVHTGDAITLKPGIRVDKTVRVIPARPDRVRKNAV